MTIIETTILAFALAMDAFAVSISIGISTKDKLTKNALTCGIAFGAFQGGMALIGLLVATSFSKFIEPIDHWVAFSLLSLIGAKMIYESFNNNESYQLSSIKALLILSVATSIDALAAGISLAAINASYVLSISLISIITFALSFFGVLLGARLSKNTTGKGFEILGGVILIGIGIKILIDHL